MPALSAAMEASALWIKGHSGRELCGRGWVQRRMSYLGGQEVDSKWGTEPEGWVTSPGGSETHF